ncbi:MAG: hypothetical protein IKT52_01540 [Oscillospiraceae bacterium]|nr:hypothetical protein [Oscillospiraceae bacterium]
MKTVLKVLTALAAIAGIVYAIATYGDKIVAWAKKILAACPCCNKTCACECEGEGECKCGGECKCEEAAEEAAAEEAPAEETVEEAAEEVVVEEVVIEENEPVANEEDFAE